MSNPNTHTHTHPPTPMNPHIPTHPPWTSALVPELSPHADRRGSAYSEGEGKSDDVEMEPHPRPRPRVPPGARKGLGTHYDLRPLLVRRHILVCIVLCARRVRSVSVCPAIGY